MVCPASLNRVGTPLVASQPSPAGMFAKAAFLVVASGSFMPSHSQCRHSRLAGHRRALLPQVLMHLRWQGGSSASLIHVGISKNGLHAP